MEENQPIKILKTNPFNFLLALAAFAFAYYSFFELNRLFLPILSVIALLLSFFSKIEVYDDGLVVINIMSMERVSNIMFDSITKALD